MFKRLPTPARDRQTDAAGLRNQNLQRHEGGKAYSADPAATDQ